MGVTVNAAVTSDRRVAWQANGSSDKFNRRIDKGILQALHTTWAASEKQCPQEIVSLFIILPSRANMMIIPIHYFWYLLCQRLTSR